MKKVIPLFLLIVQLFAQIGSRTSGGKLLPSQAAYDVKFYELDLKVEPGRKFISGSALIQAKVIAPIDLFVLNLDSLLEVEKITVNNIPVTFIHSNGLLKAELKNLDVKVGDLINAKVYYEGTPLEARRPPWDDGFVWEKTADGSDWVGVTCQGGGADIWWPCKDHPSDEPDSVSIKITAPTNLDCAANGKLLSEIDNGDGTKTTHWFVSTPINNYNVNITLAPFKIIEHTFTSITGETFPISFYVLPESYDTAKVFTEQFLDHLKFYEKYCGPYPFRADKYGIVETPYLGMEHQTIIAYGNGYKNNEFGFDWLHHHELSHEWWGNLVTAKDWRDFWIHEGIGTYMQAVYAEELLAKKGLQDYMKSINNFMNTKPILQEGEILSEDAYHIDIYYKAAWFVHTLRYYLGDEIFFTILRRWAYPTEEMENVTNGSQCRLVKTEDLIEQAEEISGAELQWLFDVYLKNAKLPELEAVLIEKDFENELRLKWITPGIALFEMPLHIKIGDEIKILEMKDGKGKMKFSSAFNPVIDPESRVLKKKVEIKKYSKKGF